MGIGYSLLGIGGCHVCCQEGFVRGCNPVDGKAFFRAMHEELVNPDNPFRTVGAWQDWLDQLEVLEVRK